MKKRPTRTALLSITPALSIVVVCAMSCRGGNPTRATVEPSPSITLAMETAVETPDPSAAASATAAAEARETPEREITGLFSDPRPSPAAETRSLSPPHTAFQPWNRNSTMLYDIVTGSETDLGTGSIGRFSPDGSMMVWRSGDLTSNPEGDINLLDLRTKSQRVIGRGVLAQFLDAEHVSIGRSHPGVPDVIDVRSGSAVAFAPTPVIRPLAKTVGRYSLRPQRERAEISYSVRDVPAVRLLLRFPAAAADLIDDSTLLVATPLVETSEPADRFDSRPTVSNIFTVDIATGVASFVATWRARGLPISAGMDYIAWTDDFCSEEGSKSRLYNRATSRIVDLDAVLQPVGFTPTGLLVSGTYGRVLLIDPETLSYVAVLPASGDTEWSPDYRYATTGQNYGHDGPCL